MGGVTDRVASVALTGPHLEGSSGEKAAVGLAGLLPVPSGSPARPLQALSWDTLSAPPQGWP